MLHRDVGCFLGGVDRLAEVAHRCPKRRNTCGRDARVECRQAALLGGRCHVAMLLLNRCADGARPFQDTRNANAHRDVYDALAFGALACVRRGCSDRVGDLVPVQAAFEASAHGERACE